MRTNRTGFTLAEIMVVCAIVTVLALGSLPLYDSFRVRSEDIRRQHRRFLARRAADLFAEVHGRPPTSLAELEAAGIVCHPSRLDARQWHEGPLEMRQGDVKLRKQRREPQ